MDEACIEAKNLEIARAWCAAKGAGWSVKDTAGRGGTAPVFTLNAPSGEMALKLYDAAFSEGDRGAESERRLKPQLDLGLHNCPYLVRVHDGGRFDGRLFVLMDKAPGDELEKKLPEVPREKIRQIMHQITEACIFLRGKGLCHRDIKSANIFITNDFNRVTLLDLSVLRDVFDPIGLGTDHGDSLPVVATSRYSPPEYLFRLMPADSKLWHALDVYQLGGVLHDLIMREPMFQQEYLKNRDSNRYRFAWVVATQNPIVRAIDVDRDLILLSRRALDKNWERRGRLKLEDFLDSSSIKQGRGLELLGLNASSRPPSSGKVANRKRLSQIAEEVDAEIVRGLRSAGVTPQHDNGIGADEGERRLVFRWESPASEQETPFSNMELSVLLRRTDGASSIQLDVLASLQALVGGISASATVELPSLVDELQDGLGAEAAGSVLGVLGELAEQVVVSQGEV